MSKLRAFILMIAALGFGLVVTQAAFAGESPLPTSDADTSVVLVIDVSSSMSGSPLARAKEASTLFIDSVDPTVPIALITFSNTAQVVQEYTTDRDALRQHIEALEVYGATALYDGARLGIDTANASGAEENIVILLSDGAEYGGQSKSTREAALEAANTNTDDSLTVITIGLGFGIDRSYLNELTQATGGVSYEAPTADELLGIYTKIGADIIAQRAEIASASDASTIPSMGEPGLGDNPLLVDSTTSVTVGSIDPLANDISALNINEGADTSDTAGVDLSAIDPGIEGVSAPPTPDPAVLSDALTSEIAPITVTVDESFEVLSAELAINGRTLATFTAPPFTYDLDTTMLLEGDYVLSFTANAVNNIVTSDQINFTVTMTDAAALAELTGAANSETAIEGDIELPAVDEATEADETVVVPPAIRILSVEGRVVPFNFSFSPINGLELIEPSVETLAPGNQSLGEILSEPLKFIPAPVLSALTTKNPELWSVVIIVMTVTLLPQGIFTLFYMLYTWNNPRAAEEYRSPKEYITPRYSFTALLPARREQDVIKDTIYAVERIDYPNELKEILVLIRDDDDDETIARTNEAIAELPHANIKLITFTDGPKNKPNGLNRGLKVAENEVICIFDAEDEPHPDIYNIINTVMVRDNADVVQSGVQLMNFKSTWFSALNCLEYFFWFKSGLHAFTRKFRVTPLGGNTVFFKKTWLNHIGGWDEGLLTEDADVGFRLTIAGAKISIVYDEKHATQEETPHNVDSFIKQRTRWCQGFYEIFFKGDWLRLPGLTRKIVALYILLNSLMQALIVFYLPVGIYIALTQQIPVPIALISYIPIFMLLAQLVINLIGIREFTAAYGQRMPFLFSLKMMAAYYPFQLLLTVSAFRAVFRFITRKNAWEKTEHSNLHRQGQAATAAARLQPQAAAPESHA
jgi:glycosyltransferase XagB